jgi:hypothetical protein
MVSNAFWRWLRRLQVSDFWADPEISQLDTSERLQDTR